MLRLALLASLFAIVTPRYPLPCERDHDCPKYRVLERYNGYELRRYEPSLWVGTRSMLSYSWRDSSFSKLFSYISGNNRRGLKIPMTAPVLSMYTPERGMFNNQWAMSEMLFMIPHNMRGYAPQPNDPTVYLKRLPEMDVYVKSYGGYSNYGTKLAKVRELKNEINNRYVYNNNYFLSAGYNGPSDDYSMRHNEVWLVSRM